MLICPKCGYEYREGFTDCLDCAEKLVQVDEAQLDAMTMKIKKDKPRAMDPVLLAERVESIDADMLVGLLENEGIPVSVRDIDAGGYLTIYMGHSVLGKNLFVDKGDEEKARKILNMYRSENVENLEEPEDSSDFDIEMENEFSDDTQMKNRQGYRFRRGAMKFWVIVVAGLFLLPALAFVLYIIISTLDLVVPI